MPIGAVAAALLALTAAPAADMPAPRQAQAHGVVSTHDPRLAVRLPASVSYLGGDRWVMPRYADACELHLFVEGGPDRRVRRLYWVQFEAYLPSAPQAKHDYHASRRIRHDGVPLFLDGWPQGAVDKVDAESDVAHMRALLASKGWRLAPDMAAVRLVHLTDATARRELMVIYVEALLEGGPKAADLDTGGARRAEWPAVEARTLSHALARVRFTPGPPNP